MKFITRFAVDALVGFFAASTYLFYVHDKPVTIDTVWISLWITLAFRAFVWLISMKTLYAVSREEGEDGEDYVNVVALAPTKGCTKDDQNQAVCQFAKQKTVVIDVFGYALFKMGFQVTALKFKIKPDWDKYARDDETSKLSDEERDAIHQKFLDRIARLKKSIDDKDDEDKEK